MRRVGSGAGAQRGAEELLHGMKKNITLQRRGYHSTSLPCSQPYTLSTPDHPERGDQHSAREHGRLPSPARSRAYMQWLASLISKSARTSPPALSDHRALGPGDFWNFASDPTTHPLHYLTVWDLLTSIVLERPRRPRPAPVFLSVGFFPDHISRTPGLCRIPGSGPFVTYRNPSRLVVLDGRG